jgi:hypothetical protein
MSIASEEANNLYSKPNERTISRSNIFDFGDLRSYQRAAYQRGRTAEPTEAEIEAVAKQIYLTVSDAIDEYDHWMGKFRAAAEWDELTDESKDEYRKYARLALEAARKAVTE